MPKFDYKNIRAMTNLTQEAFAERVGLNPSQIRRRESGETDWKMDEFLRICDEFGLQIELNGTFTLTR